MRGACTWHMRCRAIAERAQIDPLEERLTLAKHHGRDCKMNFVHMPGLDVLARGLNTTADLDVQCSGGLPGALQRRLDTVGDEVKRRAPFHLD